MIKYFTDFWRFSYKLYALLPILVAEKKRMRVNFNVMNKEEVIVLYIKGIHITMTIKY